MAVKDGPHHIGKNGPAPCNAEPGHCPLGGESGTENHYPSFEAADKAYAEQNVAKQFATMRKSPPVQETIQDYERYMQNMDHTFYMNAKNLEEEVEDNYDTPTEDGQVTGWNYAYAMYREINQEFLDSKSDAYPDGNTDKFVSAMRERIDMVSQRLDRATDRYVRSELAGEIEALEEAAAIVEKRRNEARDHQMRGQGAEVMHELKNDFQETLDYVADYHETEHGWNSSRAEDGEVEAKDEYIRAVSGVIDAYKETGKYDDAKMSQAIEALREKASAAEKNSNDPEYAKALAAQLRRDADRLEEIRSAALADSNPLARKEKAAMDQIRNFSSEAADYLEGYGATNNDAVEKAKQSGIESVLISTGRLVEKYEKTGRFPSDQAESEIRHLINLQTFARTNYDGLNSDEAKAEIDALSTGIAQIKAANRAFVAPNADAALAKFSNVTVEMSDEVTSDFSPYGHSRAERAERAPRDLWAKSSAVAEMEKIVYEYQKNGYYEPKSVDSALQKLRASYAKTTNTDSLAHYERAITALTQLRDEAQLPKSDQSPVSMRLISGVTVNLEDASYTQEIRAAKREAIQDRIQQAREHEREAHNHFILGRDRKIREAQEEMLVASEEMRAFDVSILEREAEIERYRMSIQESIGASGNFVKTNTGWTFQITSGR